MPRKRKASELSSTFSSSSEDESEKKPIRVCIVDAKLDSSVLREMHHLLESPANHSSLRLEECSDAGKADVIVTAIHMRRRLERHLDWNIAKDKAIVTPQWLRDSVREGRHLPCGSYAALRDLADQTSKNCPTNDDAVEEYQPNDVISTTHPTDSEVFLNWRSKYACTRASPLVCPNQDLVDEMKVLCRSRELEGLRANALSYERAIGMIKSYPHRIDKSRLEKDILGLPGFGEKMASKIREFLNKGYIEESRGTRESQRYQSLSLFNTIYGIGPSNAQKLYDLGLRTIEDLERYYDVPPGADISEVEALLKAPDGQLSKDKIPPVSIPVALVLRKELDIKIPKEEVLEIHKLVMGELQEIQKGCISTIVGGFRRGKEKSNDVDIVISLPLDFKHGSELMKGLCKKLTRRLYGRGLVTHVMHLSGFHAHDALRTEQWDSLEKALTVFLPPPSIDGRQRVHRRVDLIFAVPEAYWTAVIGWSGSKLFERDLRSWAEKEKGMKFDSSGLWGTLQMSITVAISHNPARTRRRDTKRFVPRSEEEVFEMLGLRWIDPTMRNADA